MGVHGRWPPRPLEVVVLLALLAVALAPSPTAAQSSSPADLALTGLVPTPSVARAGDPVSVTVTVRNQGAEAAGAFRVGLYLAGAGATPESSLSPLATASVDGLDPGATRVVSLSFTVPDGPPRPLPVVAVADDGGALAEGAEGNNRRTAAVQVTVPDLAIGGLALRPGAARVGDAVTATVVVRNAGRVPADPTLLRLYLEPGIGLEPLLLGALTVDALAPGQAREIALPFAVPAVAPGRSYRVRAEADADAGVAETDERNNGRGAWLAVAIPDLTISGLTLRPGAARAGDTVSAALVVRNAGRVPADPTLLRLYLESGAGLAPAPLATAPLDGLAPGQSSPLSVAFTVPAVDPGRYQVWAEADAAGSVAETEERNNRRGAWLAVTLPDLTITALSAVPALVRAGDAFSASLRVRNQGPVPAGASRLSLYVTTTSTAPLDGLAPVATADVPELGPGRDVALAVPVTPPVLAAGAYQLVAIADAGSGLAETSETNNRRAARFEVATPALAVAALDLAPSIVTPGQVATARVRVQNQGRVSSRATTADVFLATSATAQLYESIPVQTLALDSLKPGGSVTVPVTVPVPQVDAGAYYLIAQVDAAAAVGGWTALVASTAATATASNAPRRSLKLRVSQPDLAPDAPAVNARFVRAGDGVTVTFGVRNLGTLGAGPSQAALYLAARADVPLAEAALLATQPVPAVAAGATARLATPVTLPAVEGGPHVVIVVVDADGTVVESVETNNRGAAALEVLEASGDLTVWVVDTLTRVQPTDPPGSTSAAVIKAARNEYEAFQIVVRAPDDQTLTNVNAVASDLEGPGVIPRQNVTLYRAHYVQVTQPSPGSPYPPGWWPDALIPFVHPETGQPLGGRFPSAPFPVSAGRNQPVWVEVFVPPGTPPGTYTGTVTLTAAGLRPTVVPVALTVWAFTLPARSSVRTAFGELWCFWDKFGVSPTSSAAGDIDWRISKTLLQHRVTVSRPGRTLGWFASDGTALPAGALDEWLGTLGATTWQIPTELFPDPLGADRPRMIRYLRTMYDHLAARGWADRAFLYTPTTDEPDSAQEYQRVRDFAALVHEAHPNLQVLSTEQVAPEQTTWGSLVGSVDIWVPSFYNYERSDAQARQAAGDRVWVYQTGGWYGLPSWLIDFPILQHRVPLWINWVNRIEGLLYWQSTYWCEVSDPWTSTRTNGWGGHVLNGEGSLVYPGNAVGYNGPIVSARLKALRDGMEDYEYLKLLAGVAGTSVADAIARTVGTTFTSWDPSPATLAQAREAIAQRLELGH